MVDNRPPKRCKNILWWFKKDNPISATEEENHDNVQNDIRSEEKKEINETHSQIEIDQTQIPIHVEDEDIVDIETDQDQLKGMDIEGGEHEENDIEFILEDTGSIPLERDPGKRRPIGTYSLNDQDNVRRAYIVHGPFQPHLRNYPPTQVGNQNRRFCHKWFKEWSWLEYSLEKDKAYCFPCFLFDEYPSHHPSFTTDGFNGWKNVMSSQSGIMYHIGNTKSLHNASMRKWENLKNPSRHIDNVINKLSSEDSAKNRLRLLASIEAVRLLARQGCSFRGHDESAGSLNDGNFKAVLGSFKRVNSEMNKVISNAPGNAKYTSGAIQKQIVNILASKVRRKIRDELGDSKFTILIDEALDVSNKEKMAIILRFVDRGGLIRERFFKVLSVRDTCSQTLKNEISTVFTEYDLHVENIRGQGYDGANNMRGQFKGLQALFLQECPYAYYVHCFAHRLQLALNAAAKGVHDLWQFFSTLTLIVNFVDSSAKRHSMLQAYRSSEISDLVAASTLETGSGKNQACTLQRAGATRWGSHLRSISSLIKLFSATRSTIDDLYMNGVDKVQGEAKAISKALKKFDFVYCLHMMHDIMRITDFFCQALQKKDVDILNALNCLSITKKMLQDMRETGWESLIKKVETFCCEHDISMPDMAMQYRKGLRNCEKNITNEHYYRVNILCSVIDFQVSELDSRFNDNALEILVLGASFDPRHNFQQFKPDCVSKLALKYYPSDFTSFDMTALDLECEFFVADMQNDSRFASTTSASDLCRKMVHFDKKSFYPMIYRLICLILNLPVSTATTERAFSSMKIIKTKLRNKMNDEFLDDLMVLYIERTFANDIENDDIISQFELEGHRRVPFS